METIQLAFVLKMYKEDLLQVYMYFQLNRNLFIYTRNEKNESRMTQII